MLEKIIKSIQDDYKFLILYGFLIIVAYGFHMFNLTLYGDDLFAYIYPKFQYTWVVSIGRWLTRIVWALFDDDYFVPVLSLTSLLFSIYFSAKLHFKALNIKNSYYLYIFVLIFAFSPVLVEITSFKMAHFTLSIAIILITVADYNFVKYLKTNKKYNLFIASFFLSLSVSLYQAVAIFSFQFLIILLMFEILHSQSLKFLKADVLKMIKFVLLGIFLYIIEVKLSLYYYDIGVSSNQSYSIDVLLNMKNISHNLFLFRDNLIHFLLYEQHFYPQVIKYIMLVSFFFLLVFVYSDIKKQKISVIAKIFIFFVLLLFLICSPFLIGIINKTAFRYNAIIPIATLYAALITSLYYYVNKSKRNAFKEIVGIVILIVVFIFIFEQNKASTVRYANYSRDIHIANRMLSRIESNPHYAIMKKRNKCDLIIVGRRINSIIKKSKPFYSYSKGRMGTSIINCDTFTCQIQHIRELFRYVGIDESIKFRYYFYKNINEIPKRFGLKSTDIDTIQKWPAKGFLIPIKTGFVLNI